MSTNNSKGEIFTDISREHNTKKETKDFNDYLRSFLCVPLPLIDGIDDICSIEDRC